MTVDVGFSCKYCKRKIPNERTFMKHRCTQMERSELIQTIIGQSAYGYYKRWLERQKKKAPSIETFCVSNYFTSFIKLAEWFRQVGVPDPEKYIELMVDAKISPTLWRRNEAYQLYLEYVDTRSDPYEQAGITAETITALAEGLEVPPAEVFGKLSTGEVLELIQQRRLSPWLLFCSKSFKQWIGTLHEADRTALMKGIGIDYWAGRLEKSTDIVRNLKEVAEHLGI